MQDTIMINKKEGNVQPNYKHGTNLFPDDSGPVTKILNITTQKQLLMWQSSPRITKFYLSFSFNLFFFSFLFVGGEEGGGVCVVSLLLIQYPKEQKDEVRSMIFLRFIATKRSPKRSTI